MKVKLQITGYYFKNFKGQSSKSIKGVNLGKNYYKILQVDNCACEATIKKGYFRLAKKLHPDVNPAGHNEFTQLQQAYNVLCDKELKMYYDQNNSFYPRYKPQPAKQQPQQGDDLNYRDRHFYEYMKNKGSQDFREYEEERERQEKQKESQEQKNQGQDQESKQKRRIQQQVKIASYLLFSRNPIWQRANSYMNYQERMKQSQEKQKKFEDLFDKDSKIGKFWKKFI